MSAEQILGSPDTTMSSEEAAFAVVKALAEIRPASHLPYYDYDSSGEDAELIRSMLRASTGFVPDLSSHIDQQDVNYSIGAQE